MTSTFSSTAHFASTRRARLLATVGEVLAVFFAMAVFAQRDAVAENKTKVWKFCPFLDVVSVDLSFDSAPDTSEAISSVDGHAPLDHSVRESGALTLQASAIFPRGGLGGDLAFHFASLRAIDRAGSFVLMPAECVPANRACQDWGPCSPASLAAPLGSFAVGMNGERTPASSTLAGEHRLGLGHGVSIAQIIEPRYVDVAVARWEKFAGEKAVLDD